MKVEWKKFSEEQPPEDQVIWVHHKSGTRYMIDPMSVDEEHTHWAFVDWPEPPEPKKKWRIKSNIEVEISDDCAMLARDFNSCENVYLVPKDFLEEVQE